MIIAASVANYNVKGSHRDHKYLAQKPNGCAAKPFVIHVAKKPDA